jgi:hypothetical protein
MCDYDRHFEYVGTEPFRIAASAEREQCVEYLAGLRSALYAGDSTALCAARYPFLAHEMQIRQDPTQFIHLLDSLLGKLHSKGSVAEELQHLLAWAGVASTKGVSADTSVRMATRIEFAGKVLEAVIPVALSDFYAAVNAVWARMESGVTQNGTGYPDASQLASFQTLAEWVSRVDSPESWQLLMRWVKNMHPWVRNQTAWFLRRWSSPDLSMALCDAVMRGVEDSVAHEQTFFLFWRLTQLRDPEVLPALESLIGTGFDKEILPPGDPPPSMPRSNMLRKAIQACGGCGE